MTLGELIESLKCDDNGGLIPLSLEVRFQSARGRDMTLLSVYPDHDEGVVNIDVG